MARSSFNEQASRLDGEVFGKIVAEMEDGIIAIDAHGMILYCNPSAATLFQQSTDELAGQPIDTILPPRFRHAHRDHLAGFMKGPVDAKYMGSRKSFIVGYRADGTEISLGATILRTSGSDGPIFIAVLRDLTERHHHQSELERLANTDPLSGINNRRAFVNLAGRELERCRRDHSPVAMVLFDLDGFKAINDRYGHDVGDTVICEFANIMKSIGLDSDLLARWGGEEFIAIMPDATLDRSLAVAELVRRNVEVLGFGAANGLALPMSVSAGVTVSQDANESLDELVRRADLALYAAKAGGRNRVATQIGETTVAA